MNTPRTVLRALLTLAFAGWLLSGRALPARVFGVSPVPVESKNAALQHAVQATGFGLLLQKAALNADSIVVLSVVRDSTTPFLAQEINGRAAWEVRFDSIYLDLLGWQPVAVQSQVRKNFTVQIDSATGTVLRISGYACDGSRSHVPLLLGDVATAAMRGGREEIQGYPDSLPGVTFLDALTVAAGTQPLSVTELHAWLVNWSHLGNPAIPVWMIIGTPVRESGRGMAPGREPGWERVRSMIDATDGRPRAFTNTP